MALEYVTTVEECLEGMDISLMFGRYGTSAKSLPKEEIVIMRENISTFEGR